MPADSPLPEDAALLASSLLEAFPGGVVHVRSDGTIAAANAEALRILGRDLDDLFRHRLSHCHLDLVDEHGRPCSAEAVPAKRAFTTGQPQPGVTLGVRRPDGDISWAVFRAVPVRDPETGKVAGVLVAFLDITDRIQAEQELHRSRELLRKSQELAGVGAWEWDVRTGEVRWTGGMYALHGLDPATPVTQFEEAMGFIHPEDRTAVRHSIEHLLRGGEEPPMELRLVGADGKERVVWGSAEVVFDDSGRPVKAIGALQDVTDRHALETQLRQAQRLESIGQLAGGIAHDFNNLMQPILGNADLILKGADPKVAAAEIRLAAQRGADLTRQLLAFGRRQPFRPEALDPNELVLSFVKLLRRVVGSHVSVEVDTEPHLGAILADRGQVEQVLMNLGINARDAMPSGGRLTLRTRAAPASSELRRRHPDATHERYVEITVADTGVGMDAQVRTRIFEPFFTTKGAGAGTGLGLSVVYGILRRHGGFIDVESRPGEGSTFRVYLPSSEAPPHHVAPSSEPPAAPGREETLLVVEDDEAVRRVTVQLLESAGYRVLSAPNADEATRRFEAHHDDVDAMVTDVAMPGCDGPELARRLTRRNPRLRVVYVTGYASQANTELGDCTLLQKPYGAEELLGAVRQVLDG